MPQVHRSIDSFLLQNKFNAVTPILAPANQMRFSGGKNRRSHGMRRFKEFGNEKLENETIVFIIFCTYDFDTQKREEYLHLRMPEADLFGFRFTWIVEPQPFTWEPPPSTGPRAGGSVRHAPP